MNIHANLRDFLLFSRRMEFVEDKLINYILYVIISQKLQNILGVVLIYFTFFVQNH